MPVNVTPEVASAHKNLRDLCEKFETSVGEFCASPLEALCTQDFYESECILIAAACVDALSTLQSAQSYEVTAYENAIAEAETHFSRQKLELEEAAARRIAVYDAEIAATDREFRQQKRKLVKKARSTIDASYRMSTDIDKDIYRKWAAIGIIPSMIAYWFLGGNFHDSGWDVFFTGVVFGLLAPYIVAGVWYLLKKSAIVESERRFTVASKTINDEKDNSISRVHTTRNKKIEDIRSKRDKEKAEATEANDAAVASASAERTQHINTALSKKDQAMAYIEKEYQVFDTRLCLDLDRLQSFVDAWSTDIIENSERVETRLTRVGNVSFGIHI